MSSKRWYKRPEMMSSPARLYRVEHRTADTVQSLGLLADVPPHLATLAPFASRLVQTGAQGELVLVEVSTGAEVVRQDVAAGPRRAPAWTPAEDCRGHGRDQRAAALRIRSEQSRDRLVDMAEPEVTGSSGESWPAVDEAHRQEPPPTS